MQKTRREYLYKIAEEKNLTINLTEVLNVELDMKNTCSINEKVILQAIPHEMKPNIHKKGFYAKSLGGIWGIRDSNGIWYDICETSSIASEMVRAIRSLYSGKKYARRNVYKSIKRNIYRIYKSQQIYKSLPKNKKVYFVILEYEQEKEKRIQNEVRIALSSKALFWSPNYKQNNIIKSLMEE